MAIGILSPVAIQQFFDNNGNPLSGGRLAFYLAGTDTPTPAYADDALAVPLTNPVILDGAGRAPELFLDALSYKQVLSTAAGVVIWTADHIVSPTALRSAGGQTSATGPQHNLPVPRGVVGFIDFRNATTLTISGFSGGAPGQILLLRALGAGNVELLNDSASSTLGNRLLNAVGSGPTVLASGQGTALYIYEEGTWILIQHEQGAWLPLPTDAAAFGSDGGAAWTMPGGAVRTAGYKLMGTSLLVTLGVAGSTVTGPAPEYLHYLSLPYLIRTTALGLLTATADAAASAVIGYGGANANTRILDFIRQNNAPWTPGVAGTSVFLQTTLDVQ